MRNNNYFFFVVRKSVVLCQHEIMLSNDRYKYKILCKFIKNNDNCILYVFSCAPNLPECIIRNFTLKIFNFNSHIEKYRQIGNVPTKDLWIYLMALK